MDDPNVQTINGLLGDTSNVSDPDVQAINGFLAGMDPHDVAWARAHMTDKQFIGWCQNFVGQATGGATQGSTALEAWNNAQKKVQGLGGIKSGDIAYFGPENTPEGAGHAAIYSGNNNIISGGYGEMPISQWEQQYGGVPLGYVPQ